MSNVPLLFSWQLILSPDLKNVMAISSVVGGNDAAFAKALLRIFRREQQEAMLLRTVNEKEIEKEGKTRMV